MFSSICNDLKVGVCARTRFYDKLKRTDKEKAQVQKARAKQAAPAKGAAATAPKVSPPDMVGAMVHSELFKKMQSAKTKQAAPAKGAFANVTAPNMSAGGLTPKRGQGTCTCG